MKITVTTAAALAALSAGMLAAGVALAQAPKADAKAGAPPPSSDKAYGDADADAAEGAWAPVLKVTGVEVMRSVRKPELDVIRVQGVSSTDAWESPQVVPLTRVPSTDGVLELLFIARVPAAAVDPTGFGMLEAIFVIEPGHPYKSIRVRSATNSVLLTRLPGVAEAAAPLQDCASCVGKVFVAKGATPPSGVASSELVREEELPANVRVVKASEGISKFDSDPNRLTLVLGDTGRIVLAVWD